MSTEALPRRRRTSTPDASAPDIAMPADAGSDRGTEDTGCSCRAVGGDEAPWTSALPALGTIALLAFSRRRRSR